MFSNMLPPSDLCLDIYAAIDLFDTKLLCLSSVSFMFLFLLPMILPTRPLNDPWMEVLHKQTWSLVLLNITSPYASIFLNFLNPEIFPKTLQRYTSLGKRWWLIQLLEYGVLEGSPETILTGFVTNSYYLTSTGRSWLLGNPFSHLLLTLYFIPHSSCPRHFPLSNFQTNPLPQPPTLSR